jgi:hypothetical protein
MNSLTEARAGVNGTAGKKGKPRPKPPRFIRWVQKPGTYGCPVGILAVTEGKEVDHYFATPISSDYGEAWIVQKLVKPSDPEGHANPAYHVNLDRQIGRHSCECKGHLRWGRCRHVEGLLALTTPKAA